MSLEFLESKKRAIENALKAYEDFQGALEQLPKQWREEILSSLSSAMALGAAHGAGNKVYDPEPHPFTKLPARLKPSSAVRDLLRQHPDGLTPNEIVTSLIEADIVDTRVENKHKLLYSTIAVLRRSGQVIQDENRVHRLAQ